MMIHFSRRALRCAALATLLLPAAAFLLTWVRLPVSVPCVLAIAAAFILYSCKRKQVDLFGRAEDDFALPPAAVLAVVLCALAWTFFSGIGGYFYTDATPSFTTCSTTAGRCILTARPTHWITTSVSGFCPRWSASCFPR